jgi:hypothetical protein
MARKFAARITTESSDEARRLERAYRLALGRSVAEEERTQAMRYLDQAQSQLASRMAAWESLCRALLLTNEFVYVQ